MGLWLLRGASSILEARACFLKFAKQTLIDVMTLAGLVGFAKDYGTTRSFKDTGTDELFFILQSSAPLLTKLELQLLRLSWLLQCCKLEFSTAESKYASPRGCCCCDIQGSRLALAE